MLFEGFSHAAHGAAGAHTCHKHIHSPFGVGPNFFAGGGFVDGGIGGIHKLPQNHGSRNAIAQGFCLCNGAFHAFGGRGEFELCTVCFQQIAALDAHALRHGEDGAIAFCHAHPSESYAGVAAGGFNDGGARLQYAFLLGIFYHGKRYAVFHTAARIECFHFHCNSCFLSFKSAHFHQGCVAN